jgi:hypothetical protein
MTVCVQQAERRRDLFFGHGFTVIGEFFSHLMREKKSHGQVSAKSKKQAVQNIHS